MESELVKTTNNQIFIVKAGNKEYVLKLYKSKSWRSGRKRAQYIPKVIVKIMEGEVMFQ